jgi:hypothetical protein
MHNVSQLLVSELEHGNYTEAILLIGCYRGLKEALDDVYDEQLFKE